MASVIYESGEGFKVVGKKVKLLLGISLIILGVVAGCTGRKEAVPSVQTKATVENVVERMETERLLFTGGYIYATSDASTEPIATSYAGGVGLLHGLTEIDNTTWAKVTTREKISGWYPLSQGLQKVDLVYQLNYPRITGLHPQICSAINREIEAYVEALREAAGPVGSDLRYRITYNKQNVLSILFAAPAILCRSYSQEEINTGGAWEKISRYAYLSDMVYDKYAERVSFRRMDLRYALTFDLTTGKRLTLTDCGLSPERIMKKLRLKGLGTIAEEDNFYLTQDKLICLYDSIKTQRREGYKMTLPTGWKRNLGHE